MTDPNDPRLAVARRIKRALLAEGDRVAGIDTRLRRPLIESLPALCAQLSARHDLGLRVIEQILDDVVPMLDLLARVREVVDRSVADNTYLAAIDGWAEVRDLLYPDTEVARQLNERRRMTPAEHAAERERADAAEAEAWGAGSDIPAAPPTCPTCGARMHRLSMHRAGERQAQDAGEVCLACSGLGKLLAARHDPGWPE